MITLMQLIWLNLLDFFFQIFAKQTTPAKKLEETSFYAGMMALLGFLRFLTQLGSVS